MGLENKNNKNNINKIMSNVFLHHPEKDGELREEIVKLNLDKIKLNKVKSVKEFLGESENVYDLRVEDVPNYSTDISIVHNGGGKRKGSFAIYLEPWHADVEDFLELRKNTGKEERRARDLFLALWIPDLFMERVEKDLTWSLFSPSEVPGLHEVYGQKFVDLYTKAEAESKARRTVKARDLWAKILESQIETGTPYVLFKDAANRKSNQQNLGTIKSSNLCLDGDTIINVIIDGEESNKKLSEVVALVKKGVKILVKSLNIETNEIEFEEITKGALMDKDSEVIEIEDTETGKKIICTEDHQIYTKNRGYVKAGDLLEDDILFID